MIPVLTFSFLMNERIRLIIRAKIFTPMNILNNDQSNIGILVPILKIISQINSDITMGIYNLKVLFLVMYFIYFILTFFIFFYWSIRESVVV